MVLSSVVLGSESSNMSLISDDSLSVSLEVMFGSVVLGSISLVVVSQFNYSLDVSLIVVFGSVVLSSISLVVVLKANVLSMMSGVEVFLDSSCMSSVVDSLVDSCSQVSFQLSSVVSIGDFKTSTISGISSFGHG